MFFCCKSVANWCIAQRNLRNLRNATRRSKVRVPQRRSRGEKKMRSAGLGSFWPSWPSWFQGPTIWARGSGKATREVVWVWKVPTWSNMLIIVDPYHPWNVCKQANIVGHFWPLLVWSAWGWGFTVVCQLLGLSEAMFGYPSSIYHASNICNTTMQKYNQWINQCSRHDVCSYYIQYIIYIYFIVQ